MTLTLNVPPLEEAWLNTQVLQQGLPATEIVNRLIGLQARNGVQAVDRDYVAEANARNEALYAQWAEEDATPGLSAKTLETIAWLDAQIEEGKKATPKERRLAHLEVEELKRNLNANRAAVGDRLAFP